MRSAAKMGAVISREYGGNPSTRSIKCVWADEAIIPLEQASIREDLRVERIVGRLSDNT